MLRRGIVTEFRWLLVFLSVGLVLGLVMGAVTAALLLSCLAFILWQFYQLYSLEAWVANTRQQGLRDNHQRGIWSEIAEDVVLLIRRFEKDRSRLQDVVGRVQSMTSALSDGVIIVDKRNNIEWWNHAAERQFDFQPLDIGHKITNYIRDPKFIRYYDSGEYREPLDLPSSRLDGQCLQYHVHPFGDGDRLVIARDVTRVANLERIRKDFVANVSHELRTPLTVLAGYLETLADSNELSPSWNRALDQMQDQTKRMTSLINDLLLLSRLETDDREVGQKPVRVRPLLEQIVADAKVISGERGHLFHIDCDPNIQLLGREGELRSAIANLVYNAVNYTPDGRKVSILVDLMPPELVVKVKDNGEGIDPRHIPRLTERFYRVDTGRSRESGGTGLGLAIVKHILLRHDADLKIKSKPGKGSTFSCHFPLKRFIDSVLEET